MRGLGLLLASLGGTGLVYVGANIMGDIIFPPTAPPDRTETLLIVGIGGLCVAIGLSLASRTR